MSISLPARAAGGPHKLPVGQRPEISISKLTQRFRVILEESWHCERPEVRNPDRRWYEIIPCHGFKSPTEQEGPFIGLYSEAPPLLKLYTDRPRNGRAIWEVIKDHPGAKADFGFDGESELLFPPELLEVVAGMAGGKRRRQLSEAHKEAMARGREKAGLVRDERGRISHSQTQNSTPDEAIPAQARGLKAMVFQAGEDGGPDIPTRKGLTLSVDLYPQFRGALAQVKAAMIEDWWLDREDLE